MRVYSEKTFLFKDRDEKVLVRNKDIIDVPDWIASTDLFKLAEKSGDIQIINSSTKQKEVENNKKNKKQENIKEESPSTDKE